MCKLYLAKKRWLDLPIIANGYNVCWDKIKKRFTYWDEERELAVDLELITVNIDESLFPKDV